MLLDGDSSAAGAVVEPAANVTKSQEDSFILKRSIMLV
jgi:hypothetical protein